MSQHSLTLADWSQLSFYQQMANVGSEVERAIKWTNKQKPEYATKAFHRSLELLDLTIQAHQSSPAMLQELCRLRETIVDYFYADNQYGSSDDRWHNYFHPFNYAARVTHL